MLYMYVVFRKNMFENTLKLILNVQINFDGSLEIFQIWKMSFPFLYFSLNIILFTVRVSSHLKTIFNIYKVF